MCTFILSDKTDVGIWSTYVCLQKRSHFEDKKFYLGKMSDLKEE